MKQAKTLKTIILALLVLSKVWGSRDSNKLNRVVSMSPAITQTLVHFKLQDKIVGISDYCKLPESLIKKNKIERVGSPFSPFVEKLVSLKPDVVLTQEIKDTKFVQILEKLSLKYRPYEFGSLEEIHHSVNKIATTYKGTGLENFNKDWQRTLNNLRRKQKAGNYLAIIGIKGELSQIKGFVVAADDTYLGEVLTATGLTNLSPQQTGYGDIGLETFLTKKLHYLFFFSRDKTLTSKGLSSQLKKQFKNLDIKKVVVLNDENTLIPGPKVLDLMKEVSLVLD